MLETVFLNVEVTLFLLAVNKIFGFEVLKMLLSVDLMFFGEILLLIFIDKKINKLNIKPFKKTMILLSVETISFLISVYKIFGFEILKTTLSVALIFFMGFGLLMFIDEKLYSKNKKKRIKKDDQ